MGTYIVAGSRAGVGSVTVTTASLGSSYMVADVGTFNDVTGAINTTLSLTGVAATALPGAMHMPLGPTIATGQVGTITTVAYSPQSNYMVSTSRAGMGVVVIGTGGGYGTFMLSGVGADRETLDGTASLTGVAATGQAGTAASEIDIVVSGVAGTGQVGSFNVAVDGAISIFGVEATGEVEPVAIEVDESLTLDGVEATGEVGSLIDEIGGNISGVGTTGAAGTLTVLAISASAGGVFFHAFP